MQIDMYTKTVLTVIAIALSTIAVENVLTPAYAQGSIQKVMICDMPVVTLLDNLYITLLVISLQPILLYMQRENTLKVPVSV